MNNTNKLRLPRAYFAATGEMRPTEARDVVLTTISAADVVRAYDERARAVETGASDEQADSLLLAHLVAPALRKPDESDEHFFPLLGEQAAEELTPEGLRYVYERLEAMHVATSPLMWSADDADIAAAPAKLAAAPPAKAARARRLIGFALGLLDEAAA